MSSFAERYYKDATLKTVTETSDNMGGIISIYVSTTIQAYVSQINDKSSVDRLRQLGLNLINTFIIMCPIETILNKNDRIVFNTIEYVIKSDPMNPANKNHHKFAYMEAV
jgi:hypothetical protein